MTAIQEPRNGLYYNWESGEAGWGDSLNGDLLDLGISKYLSVTNMTTTVPPGSPTLGDTYVVDTAATGLWAGHDGEVAVWANPVGPGTPTPEWIFLAPNSGWLIFDESSSQLHAHNGTGFSTNGFLFTF